MDANLQHDLMMCEADIEGALRRFAGNEELYVTCLAEFLKDQTMDELELALKSQSWDNAFTAAHALKGLSGNMGFVPLFHAAAEMVMLIRNGRLKEIDVCHTELKRCYYQITATIRQHCCDK